MDPLVLAICRAVRESGGRAMLVGGSVRDLLLGFDSKDYDLEVYSLSPDKLRDVLQTIAPVNTVGEQFAVYKLAVPRTTSADQRLTPVDFMPGEPPTSSTPSSEARHRPNPSARIEVDVSIPRRESKSGPGHRGFLITGDPSMSFEEAAGRRDFTVNAILLDPLTGQKVDPTGGIQDLKERVLRAVSACTFVEDSLRVLRAMQLAARFEMTIEPSTVELCRSIDLSDLPRERIRGEIEKLLIASRPSIGLQAAWDLLILDKLFPSIAALHGCPQNPKDHPEGDVFTHIKLAIDQAARLTAGLPPAERLAAMLGTLLHDVGKPLTIAGTGRDLGHPQHDEAGIRPALTVLETLGIHTVDGYDVRDRVLALVAEHLRPGQFYSRRAEVCDGDFRRLARKVDLGLLYLVAKADALGRCPGASAAAEEWFIGRAREIGVEHGPPPPLLMGRHLIEAGLEPGPRMGEILREVYERQLDGEIDTVEGAIEAAMRIARDTDSPSPKSSSS